LLAVVPAEALHERRRRQVLDAAGLRDGHRPHLVELEPGPDHDGGLLVAAAADEDHLVALRAAGGDPGPRDDREVDAAVEQPLRHHPRRGLRLDLDLETFRGEEALLLRDVGRHLTDAPEQRQVEAFHLSFSLDQALALARGSPCESSVGSHVTASDAKRMSCRRWGISMPARSRYRWTTAASVRSIAGARYASF